MAFQRNFWFRLHKKICSILKDVLVIFLWMILISLCWIQFMSSMLTHVVSILVKVLFSCYCCVVNIFWCVCYCILLTNNNVSIMQIFPFFPSKCGSVEDWDFFSFSLGGRKEITWDFHIIYFFSWLHSFLFFYRITQKPVPPSREIHSVSLADRHIYSRQDHWIKVLLLLVR